MIISGNNLRSLNQNWIVAVITLDFPAEAVVALREQSQNHPHPSVRLKAQAVLMKSHGIAHGQIQATLGITGNTLRSYLRTYASGGTVALEFLRFYQPAGRLDNHQQSLSEYFATNPPASINQAAKCQAPFLRGSQVTQSQKVSWLRIVLLKRINVTKGASKPDIDSIFFSKS